MLSLKVTPSDTVLFGFLLAPVVAGFVAGGLCRLSVLRDREPPWSHAILAASLGMFSSLWGMFGDDVFRPALWPGRIPQEWDSFPIALPPSIALTAVVVMLVVAVFRDRFKKHLSSEKRRIVRHHRHQRSWRRARWFHLVTSSILLSFFATCLMCSP